MHYYLSHYGNKRRQAILKMSHARTAIYLLRKTRLKVHFWRTLCLFADPNDGHTLQGMIGVGLQLLIVLICGGGILFGIIKLLLNAIRGL